MRIYFAAPFTNLAKPYGNSDYGWVSNRYTEWLKKIIRGLESMGHEVHCPHSDDHRWGKAFPKLEELVPKQYRKITQESDLLLAYLGEPQSGGVAIEIGYAVSHGIRTIIIKRAHERITVIAYGLNSISACEVLEFKDDEKLMEGLREML